MENAKITPKPAHKIGGEGSPAFAAGQRAEARFAHSGLVCMARIISQFGRCQDFNRKLSFSLQILPSAKNIGRRKMR